MTLDKLLGLPRTDDMIILREGADTRLRIRPHSVLRFASAEPGDAHRARKLLHDLIALRKVEKE